MMLQCSQCYRYWYPDEAYYMDHCGGVFEYYCEKCQAKKDKNKDSEEEE